MGLRGGRHNGRMVELQTLSDADLQELARHWRAQALRGAREARGIAHACEVELRRRMGPPQRADRDALDLRPLSERGVPEPWWRR